MSTLTLNATKRTVTGKQVGQLRRAGQIPAVLYGPQTQPQPIQLNTREAAHLFRRVGGTQLIDLTVDGQVHKVLVQELQRDTIRGDYLHADFYAVDMSRTIRVRLPIHLTGTSYAVVSLAGVLVHGLTEIEIECLPGDLLASVNVDLGSLKEIGSAIHVSDVPLPDTIKVLTAPEELVARVTYQTKEEDLSVPTVAATGEVEVIEKGKIEEEGVEGEAAKGGEAKAPAAKGGEAKAGAAKK